MTFSKLHSSVVPSDLVGSDNSLRANIILTAFRNAVAGGLSVQSMVDGVVDEMEDETGVDTSASTDETYNSSGDYYHNPTPAGDTEGTFGSSNLTYEEFGAAVGGKNRDHVGHQHALGSTGNVTQMRVDLYSVVSTITGHGSIWTNSGDSPAVQLGGDSDQFVWSSTGEKTITWSSDFPPVTSGSTIWLVLSDEDNSEVNIRNCSGTKVNAGATTITGMSLPDGSYGPARFRWEVTITGAAADMVLQSEIAVAETAPDEAYIVVWQEDVDSVTPNTDLIAAVSRDDGTTWTNATLVEEATLSTGRILAASVDISAQPSDTDMLWRLTVANNKEQRIHGVGLSWS